MAAAGLLALLSGCASLPAPQPQRPSFAPSEVAHTALGRIAAAA